MLLDVGSVASGLTLSTFRGQIGSSMGFASFLTDPPCVLEA